MQLSINPTYFCNFRCPQCYLGDSNLSDKKRLNLLQLETLLTEITLHTDITHIDLYGGEIGLLPYQYLKDLESVLNRFYSGSLNVITNFSNVHEFFYQDNVEITVSYDYKYREQHERVLSNIVSFPKDVHVLILAIDNIIINADSDIPIMHEMFSTVGNITSVEIKPYSENDYNSQQSTYADYEDYIFKWLALQGSYELVNRKKIEDCLSEKDSSFSDNHIYITPSGNISVLDFDDEGNEHFAELETFTDYLEWCTLEKKTVTANSICKSCDYLGHCLSEHLKDVKSLENSCNGFINLLKYYDRRVES